MATVNLSLLNRHLIDAKRMIGAAMDSKHNEPTLNFSAVRASLRKALELLGDQRTVFDAAPRPRVSVSDIWPAKHPHANHADE